VVDILICHNAGLLLGSVCRCTGVIFCMLQYCLNFRYVTVLVYFLYVTVLVAFLFLYVTSVVYFLVSHISG